MMENSPEYYDGFCDHYQVQLSGCYVLSIQNDYSEIQDACEKVGPVKAFLSRRRERKATPVVYSIKFINIKSSIIFGENAKEDLFGASSEFFQLDASDGELNRYKDIDSLYKALGIDPGDEDYRLLTPEKFLQNAWADMGPNYYLIFFLIIYFTVEVVIANAILDKIARAIASPKPQDTSSGTDPREEV